MHYTICIGHFFSVTYRFSGIYLVWDLNSATINTSVYDRLHESLMPFRSTISRLSPSQGWAHDPWWDWMKAGFPHYGETCPFVNTTAIAVLIYGQVDNPIYCPRWDSIEDSTAKCPRQHEQRYRLVYCYAFVWSYNNNSVLTCKFWFA